MSATHFQKLAGAIQADRPTNPVSGEMYWDATAKLLYVFDGTDWYSGGALTTSTSTSTTSTTTSTSTSSTSTSTSTTTS